MFKAGARIQGYEFPHSKRQESKSEVARRGVNGRLSLEPEPRELRVQIYRQTQDILDSLVSGPGLVPGCRWRVCRGEDRGEEPGQNWRVESELENNRRNQV
jgi:hypothetical protein